MVSPITSVLSRVLLIYLQITQLLNYHLPTTHCTMSTLQQLCVAKTLADPLLSSDRTIVRIYKSKINYKQ